jgi:hypothetical protein
MTISAPDIGRTLVDFLVYLHEVHGWSVDDEGLDLKYASEGESTRLLGHLVGLADEFLESYDPNSI